MSNSSIGRVLDALKRVTRFTSDTLLSVRFSRAFQLPLNSMAILKQASYAHGVCLRMYIRGIGLWPRVTSYVQAAVGVYFPGVHNE